MWGEGVKERIFSRGFARGFEYKNLDWVIRHLHDSYEGSWLIWKVP